ncbi:MAG: hypothetical protein RBS56_03300 [Candidatus Gracilibacteria bacterium]|jgi:hypothetical protein|nr:hypothetical protein [Candidatus Gracilibacteria bacterium]
MKNSSKVLTLGVGLLMLGSSAAYALTNDTTSVGSTTVSRPNQEFYEALEDQDFDTYASLYKEKTGEDLSNEAFAKILELHKLRNQEQEVRGNLDEMGVKMPGFGGKGMRKGDHGMRGDAPMLNNLTDEQKTVMEKVRELRRNGDIEGAEKLLNDSGIELPQLGQRRMGGK